jgi:hypothetical protein
MDGGPTQEDLEMQEMMGLPLAFGGATAHTPISADPSRQKGGTNAKGGKAPKIVLATKLGAGLGVAPDAPKPAEPAEAQVQWAPPSDTAAMPPPPARVQPAAAGGAAAGGAGAAADAGAASDDDELIGPPMPPCGGTADDDDDDDFVGPPMPRAGTAAADDDDDDDDASECELLDRFRLRLPTSHSVQIRGPTRTVTVIALDGAGSRMITGSSDYSMRMYDFNGMKADLKPFRQFEVRGCGSADADAVAHATAAAAAATAASAVPLLCYAVLRCDELCWIAAVLRRTASPGRRAQ